MTDTPLYQHQREAAEFAEAVGGNCALFHDPGLGKTRTSLEIFTRMRSRNPQLRLLVVCPLSLVNAAWGEDIKRFTGFTSAPFKEMGAAVPDIVIINYEALISKRHLPAIRRLITALPFMCVLDESSRLKNNKSITTKTLLELSPLFRHRIVASGTPMPNSELELWGQINFLRPEYLYKSFYAFRNTYFHLERNGQKMRLSGQYISRDYMREILSSGWRYAITGENRQRLMDKIRPLVNWVKKDDALDLPEKIDEIREVELSSEEWAAYEDMRKYLVAEINGTEITAQVALAKLMKLRQATSGFFYAADGKVIETGKSSKLRELENVIEELGDQPVIVWVSQGRVPAGVGL
ncbi:MAG: SNF2-related protein [Elusimicrobiales bacterium]|nr:SNF2-related protein [Elusimicrobiales bacterium]